MVNGRRSWFAAALALAACTETQDRSETRNTSEAVEQVEPAMANSDEATGPEPRSAGAPALDEVSCTNLACAIGQRPEHLALPLTVTGRTGRWTQLEGGISYQVDDGVVSRIRMAPCPPLRGDIAMLDDLGFTLRETEVVNLRDARELRGIEGHHLEGRPSACTIRRSD